MQRMSAVLVLVLSLSLVSVTHLQAQRSGFIIGFGLGVSVTSFSVSGSFDSGNETKAGLATDFKIGAQVSQSVQVYYLGRTNWFRTSDSDLVAAGISAIGVTYVLPSAPVQLSGGLGLATWIADGDLFSGLGLTGGVGWEFADLWLLDFALSYGGGLSEFAGSGSQDMFLARIGISILSH